jgi:hypothetical protein
VREAVDLARLRVFLKELSHSAREPVRLYLTGGASQLVRGLRESTVDVDLTFEPEIDDVLRSMVALKDRLNLNVELVSPAHFVPALPGWRDRCQFIEQVGRLAVHHFDPYTQVLSKLERGHTRDRADVAALVGEGVVDPERLRVLFSEIEAELFRYPAIDAKSLRTAVEKLGR